MKGSHRIRRFISFSQSPPSEQPPSHHKPLVSTAQERWLLIAAVLLGAALRFYRLATLPPGDSYDPAFYGIDAQQILQGAWPVYLDSNFGREVLFSYLVAGLYAFLGPGTFGIHLAAAFVGVVTIPATWLAGKRLFAPAQTVTARYAPLLASWLIALSYWHLNWSRFGVRAVLVPLFAVLVVATLWHCQQKPGVGTCAGAGFWLGLSLYTYQAALALPLLVLAWFGYLYVWGKRPFSPKHMALILTVALLVFAPMGYYAWSHPGLYGFRTGQVLVTHTASSTREQVTAVLQQAWQAIRMFTSEGHPDPLVSLPNRPSLNPILSIFFVLGVGTAVYRLRQSPYLFLLLWLTILLLPAVFAGQGSAAKRGIGTLPAVMLLTSCGLLLPLQLVDSRPRRWLAASWASIVSLVLLITGIITYRDYFLVWAQNPDMPVLFQEHEVKVGQYIGQLSRTETVMLSPFDSAHPSIQLHSRLHPNIRPYNGYFCLLYPQQLPATYVIAPGEGEHSLDTLSKTFPQGTITAALPHPSRPYPYYIAYRVPAGATPELAPALPGDVNWNNEIRLLGFDLNQTEVRPGEELSVTLYYEALSSTIPNYTAYVHLLGSPRPETESPIWAQRDSEPCHGWTKTVLWRAGDMLVDRIKLTIAADTPPGRYQLTTGFYTWPALVGVPIVTTAEETAVSPPALLTEITVTTP